MGHRLTRITSTILQVPGMSSLQEVVKANTKPFRPSQNWLSLRKTLQPANQASRKRKAEVEKRELAGQEPERQDSSTKGYKSSVGKTRLTTYDPWHPTSNPEGRKHGNPALVQRPNSESKFTTYEPPFSGPTNDSAGRYVSIDCEMVEVTEKTRPRQALARLSMVNYYGYPLLDLWVIPNGRVTDFRTRVSGIRPSDILHNPQGILPVQIHKVKDKPSPLKMLEPE